MSHKSWILFQCSIHQVIAEGAFPDSNGELTVSLLAPGHYEVQVILSFVLCVFLVSSPRCLELGM